MPFIKHIVLLITARVIILSTIAVVYAASIEASELESHATQNSEMSLGAEPLGLTGNEPRPDVTDALHRLKAFDWAVIGAYAVGMVLVGQYYSRGEVTSDDFMLGGRNMRPWAVGMSLFATLISALSYLATPGEMIQHGPMIMSQIIAYPLISIVVGWGIIPKFMSLKEASAYEILEARLGLAVRILGATMFLWLRLMWMAVILYATTSTVLIPLLGWSQNSTPIVCAALGLLTVIYTSAGGIRAVVATDVIQSFLLLGGAILAIAIITIDLGGVSMWWPREWVETWDPLEIWIEPGSRMTVSAAAIAGFSWYVCTSVSDQMTIQRYLATKDAAAARQMFNVSLIANAVVAVLLACLGLALLAWFQARPEMLPSGKSVVTDADELLPTFIVVGLPTGICGLVISGLMAAAMSSLSSGLNSTSTVIVVDFIERLRKTRSTERQQVQLARYVTWGIAVVVIGLSFFASAVPGNLVEVSFKTSNLLVGPLAVLFILAIYIPWSTAFGAFAGAGAGSIAAIATSYGEFMGLNFLWNVPVSTIVGVVIGMAASLAKYPSTTR